MKAIAADFIEITARGAEFWGCRELEEMIASWEAFVESDEFRRLSDRYGLPHDEVKHLFRQHILAFREGVSSAVSARHEVMAEQNDDDRPPPKPATR